MRVERGKRMRERMAKREERGIDGGERGIKSKQERERERGGIERGDER